MEFNPGHPKQGVEGLGGWWTPVPWGVHGPTIGTRGPSGTKLGYNLISLLEGPGAPRWFRLGRRHGLGMLPNTSAERTPAWQVFPGRPAAPLSGETGCCSQAARCRRRGLVGDDALAGGRHPKASAWTTARHERRAENQHGPGPAGPGFINSRRRPSGTPGPTPLYARPTANPCLSSGGPNASTAARCRPTAPRGQRVQCRMGAPWARDAPEHCAQEAAGDGAVVAPGPFGRKLSQFPKVIWQVFHLPNDLMWQVYESKLAR